MTIKSGLERELERLVNEDIALDALGLREVFGMSSTNSELLVIGKLMNV